MTIDAPNYIQVVNKVRLCALFCLSISFFSSLALAEEIVKKDDIIKQLTPKSQLVYRGFHLPNQPRPEAPKQDLQIQFELNSSDLTERAEAQLNELGLALLDNSFEQTVFEIAGHTDATGTERFNKDLSKARAESVKTFLASKFDIERERLKVSAWGEAKPIKTEDPSHPVNRRVEIINLGSQAQK